MPKKIEIIQINYVDDRVFIYTLPPGETIKPHQEKILTEVANKALAGSFYKPTTSIDSDLIKSTAP
jgi:hypothetical protein